MDYRYEGFGRRLLKEDVTFGGGAAPGTAFPEFNLPVADGGGWVKLSNLEGLPFVVIFGSFT